MRDFDIDKMCRVCLQTNLDLFLLFDEQNGVDGVFLSNMITELTIYTVRRHDDFPHQICLECMNKVRNAYNIKKQFEKSHRQLLTYLESINKVVRNIEPNHSNDKYVQTEDTTMFPCEKCDEKFISYNSLREHRLESHKGTDNFCRFCSKTFKRLGDLKDHIAVHHTEIGHISPHQCHICERKFTRKQHVQRHMLQIHKIDSVHLSEHCSSTEKIESDLHEPEILVENVVEYGSLSKQEDESDHLSNTHEEIKDGYASADNSFSSDDDDKPLSGLRDASSVKNKDAENLVIKTEPDENTSLKEFDTSQLEELKTIKCELTVPDSLQETPRKKFQCADCDKLFVRSTHLKRHMLSHTEIKPFQFQCTSCDKRFKRSDHLKNHMTMHDTDKKFSCDICDRSYGRADLLKRHKETKHNSNGHLEQLRSELCLLCNKSFSSQAYLQKHMRLHTNKSWKCKFCPCGFESRQTLKEHSKSHDKETPFLCSECGMRFGKKDHLLVHMRRHNGEKPYRCKYCDKGFPRATDLNVHEKYHTGEKTHLCTICGKGFQRSYNLVVHMRVHTGERPYQCIHCPKNFAQCNDLKAHVRRHTGERFKCEICGIGFVQGYHLTQHKVTAHGIEGKAISGRVSKVLHITGTSENACEFVTDETILENGTSS